MVPNHPTGFLRFPIIGVVVASAEHEGSIMIRLFTSGPKPSVLRTLVDLFEFLCVFCPITIMHSIEPGQIGRSLSCGQQVIDRNEFVEVGITVST